MNSPHSMRSWPHVTLRALCVFLVTVTVFAAGTVKAQSAPGAQVTIPSVETGFGSSGEVAGTFGRPVKAKDSLPAVLILHGSAGIDGRGAFYAPALQDAGIATLEIFMFPRGGRPQGSWLSLPQAAAALRKQQPIPLGDQRRRDGYRARMDAYAATRTERQREKKRKAWDRWKGLGGNPRRQERRRARAAADGRAMSVRRGRLTLEERLDQKRLAKHTRAVRQRGGTGRLTPGIMKRLWFLQKGVCPVCRKKLTRYHLDHIFPLALGGAHTDDNVQLLCPACNLAKGAKHPVAFMQAQGFLL